jgi:CRP-like cAMP-binding protein
VPVDLSRLHALPLLEGLEDAELGQIAESAELRTARPGDVLAREGASGYTFFAIVGGTVDVDRGGEFLETLGPGDFFGEMAIVGEGRRNATVTATSDVEVVVLFGTEFRTLEENHPETAERIRRKVAERIERARR